MATAKEKATGKGLATKKTTSMASVDEQLAQEVAAIATQIGAPDSNAISVRDKVFTLPDNSVVQGSIEMVIVDFISRNNFYRDKWDPKNPQPPVCFAINKVVKNLAPSANSPDLQVKAGMTCAECPMNEFGSDGDGKACKNTRLLALLPVDATEEDPIMTISVPPTSIKAFDGYVAQVAKLFNKPPIGVSTTISFHPERSYPSLLFSDPRPLDNVAEFLARRPQAEVLLTAEPDTSTLAPPKGGKARGNANAKPAARR